MRGVDILAVDLDRLVGDDIGDIERVLVAFCAVGGVDIVDQAFVQRPGIHLAFPVVDDRIAEAIDFRLRIGNASLDPGRTCRLKRLVAGVGEQGVDRLVECFRRRQGVLVLGMRELCVVLENGCRFGSCRKGGKAGCGSRDNGHRERGANSVFQFHVPLL